MNLEEIKTKLVLKFSAPLDEYYKRHIVFWTDSEKEFEDTVDELELEGVTIFKLTTNNFFKAKQLINDDNSGNLLIYDSTGITEGDFKQDWLQDARIMYKKESMTLDYYSMIMDKLGIANETLRGTVKQYDKFWKNEKRIDELKKVAPSIKSAGELHLGILAVLCQAPTPEVPDILYRVFSGGLNIEDNQCIKHIDSFGSREILWKLLNKYVGDCHENLKNAFDTILISALYQTMGSAMPSKLRVNVINNAVSDAYSLVSEWTHNSEYKESIYAMIKNVDSKLGLSNLFDALSLDELIGSDIFPSINEAILRKLFSASATKAIAGSKIMAMVADRRKRLWYEDYSSYYECLYSIGELFCQYDKYQGGFHFVSETDLWNQYQKDIYLFDTHYRHIHYHFYQTTFEMVDSINDKVMDAINYVENLYKNFYLNGVNDVWVKLIKPSIETSGKINILTNTQLDFFQRYVEQECEDKLTIVVISDGMRYEVAKELSNTLQYQLKCDVKIEAVQGVFPSITKYGMAAVLPGKKVIDSNINVLSGGLKTASTDDRRAVLQKHIPESDAIRYPDIIKMNTTEKKEYLKGKKLIYVYHNDIDNSGHESSGESKVFGSCKDTIEKIVNLVKSLTNARASIKVVITSDHGFIYSYQKLDEVDKMSVNSDEIVDAEGEKRCIVSKAPIVSEFLVAPKLLINNEEETLLGYAPLQTIRLKASGGPSNYVHGGLSLQELMVPVVIFDNVRTSSEKYKNNSGKYDHEPVKIELVTETRNIYGLMPKMEFYQAKPIGVDAVEATYEVVIEDKMGKAISDTKIIVANKTDGDAVNRRFKVVLNINPGTKSDKYYLLVNNQETHETIIKEEFQVINDFGGDFDF